MTCRRPFGLPPPQLLGLRVSVPPFSLYRLLLYHHFREEVSGVRDSRRWTTRLPPPSSSQNLFPPIYHLLCRYCFFFIHAYPSPVGNPHPHMFPIVLLLLSRVYSKTSCIKMLLFFFSPPLSRFRVSYGPFLGCTFYVSVMYDI